MAYEIKPNTGSVFNNERKESDSHPDRSGSAQITCPHCDASFGMWLSGWIKKSETKGNWLSLAFKPKEAKPAPQRKTGGISDNHPKARVKDDFGDDSIPF